MHLRPGQSESEYHQMMIPGFPAPLKAVLVKFAGMTASLRLRHGIPMYGHVMYNLQSANTLKKIRNFAKLMPFFNFHCHWDL